jgi:hypothetical protein
MFFELDFSLLKQILVTTTVVKLEARLNAQKIGCKNTKMTSSSHLTKKSKSASLLNSKKRLLSVRVEKLPISHMFILS